MEHVFKDDAETIRMIHMCSQDLGSTNKDMQAMLQVFPVTPTGLASSVASISMRRG